MRPDCRTTVLSGDENRTLANRTVLWVQQQICYMSRHLPHFSSMILFRVLNENEESQPMLCLRHVAYLGFDNTNVYSLYIVQECIK